MIRLAPLASACGLLPSVEFLSRLPAPLKSIAVSIAPAGSTEVRRYGIIGGSLDAVDKLVKKLSSPGVELRFVYEAGPTGFVLCRHLRHKGIHCDIIAPSLIPKKASDRVKTNRRDADKAEP